MVGGGETLNGVFNYVFISDTGNLVTRLTGADGDDNDDLG